MEVYYSLVETSELLGVKIRTLRYWIGKGRLKAEKVRHNQYWFVSKREIERLKKELKK